MQVKLATTTGTWTTEITALKESVLKWGYDATAVYYTMSTKATTKTTVNNVATNNAVAVYAAIRGATDYYHTLGCHITISSTT